MSCAKNDKILTGYIVWNGESSIDYGIGVERHPNSIRPERKIDVYSVPGRNGDIIMPQDAWENVVQEYEIFTNHAIEFNDTFQGSANLLADWLMGPTGYCKLYDEWEPDCFRMAYYRGPLELENLFSVAGRATIEFVCKPQRYLDKGQEQITCNTYNRTVENPTLYNASPIITIPQNSNATLPYTLTVGSRHILINTKNAIVIDCEEQDAYSPQGLNMNSLISLREREFPILVPGDNTATLIDAGGSVRTFYMVPNYWRL